MRYVPNLIPKSSKVLPEYFKGDIYKTNTKTSIIDIIFWFFGVIFLTSALASLEQPLVSLLCTLLGFVLIPIGHRFLQRKLRFRLTLKIRTALAFVLFAIAIPVSNHYTEINRQEVNQQKLLDDKIAKEQKLVIQKEQQRKDSLNFYIQQSRQFGKNHQTDEANEQLQLALIFAGNQTDTTQIEKEKREIALIQAFDLVTAEKYQVALPTITTLLKSDPTNTTLLYNRAICYSKTGKIQEAVTDLKPLIQVGNKDAETLYNKINPIQKRVSHYVTRCRDGSISYANGRGACSHHGGVSNWNEPVYEEYRKYE